MSENAYYTLHGTDDQEYFEFLNDLRVDGCVNMWNASIWLIDTFDLYESDAFAVFKRWKDSFKERHPILGFPEDSVCKIQQSNPSTGKGK